ncbi:LCP family protein [Streptomyces sp. NPDC058067]|uniref:LCP family protein n=1 Tax=Streptomyces sp. NPDC058067 TaxID=3346324 RepID=UPI0036EB84DD
MTDTAGTPGGPPPRPGDRGAGRPVTYGPGAGSSPTGAGRARRRRRWLRYTAIGAAVVVLGAAGAGWALYEKLQGNITEDTASARELARYEKERPASLVHGAQNILLIGSDSRAGAGNREYGRDSGTQRSDTTILLHISADHKSATAVSLPRDLMVEQPSCSRPDGTRTAATFAMFNSAFERGGSACTIRTVEKMSGVRIDHQMVIDFNGFKEMVDAVDGVQICLKKPVDDPKAHLKLPAGRQTLDGEQALGFVRARKSLGDGSDTARMDRQQEFLGALVNKVQSNQVLFNPTKLYPVLDAATSSLTTDPGLASLRGLYNLVSGMRDIPTERVQFLTVPRRSYVYNANRDQLLQPAAEQLFTRLRTDAPVVVARHTPQQSASPSPAPDGASTGDPAYEHDGYDDPQGSGTPAATSASPSPTTPSLTSPTPSSPTSPAPTFRGNTAAQDACG